MVSEAGFDFGVLLRRHRLTAGLSQEALAEAAGLSARAVAALERGERRAPRRDTVHRLATALPLSPTERDDLEAAARHQRVAATQLSPALVRPGTAPGEPAALPVSLTSLVGREREVAAVAAQLRRDDVRLLTLTGPGGVGKTRLALQVACEVRDVFPDGVAFVGLAPVVDPARVLAAVAEAVGVREMGSRPLAKTLPAALRDRRLLLLLDNFEHLLGAGPLLADLLIAAPGLKVLVTSRALLRLSGERELVVPPLAVPVFGAAPAALRGPAPVRPQTLGDCAAVRLFVARARDRRPEFALTAENALDVAEICTRLDGLPLAIELAAAHVKLLPPGAIASRLDRRFALLTGGKRDQPARHQTLRAALDWSYDLLDPPERSLFRHLGVFAGGCTLDAVEKVAAAPDALGGLTTLVDSSLAGVEADAGGEWRLSILQTVREYALERLEEADELDTAQRRHATYFLRLAEDAAPHLRGSGQFPWLDRLERERGNLGQALRWSVRRGATEIGLRLAAALWPFWWLRSSAADARALLDDVLALPGLAQGQEADGRAAGAGTEAAALARALLGAGVLARLADDYSAASAFFERALAAAQGAGAPAAEADATYELARVALVQGDPAASSLCAAALERYGRAGDRVGIAWAWNALGTLARDLGDHAAARARYHTSAAAFASLGNRDGAASSRHGIGETFLGEGNLDGAHAVFEECLARFAEVGDRSGVAMALGSLGRVATERGVPAIAGSYFQRSLAIAGEVGDRRQTAYALAGLAAAVATARPALAARLAGAAAALCETLQVRYSPPMQRHLDTRLAAARRSLGAAAFAAAWEEGSHGSVRMLL